MINAYEINPYIRRINYRVFDAKEIYSSTEPADHELAYVYRGEVIISGAKRECSAHEGDLLLFSPADSFTITAGASGTALGCIHFDPIYDLHSERAELTNRPKDAIGRQKEDLLVPDNKLPILKLRDKTKVRALFDTVFDTAKSDSYIKRKSAFLELISALAENNFKSLIKLPDPHPIEIQIKAYIDSGRCMSSGLEELAGLFAYDKFYLEKRFRERFGTGIISYRNQKRMEVAKELLKSDTVSGVAEKTGFKSIYSFSRAYKQFYGIAPSKEPFKCKV